jgi:hypothetical protein
MPSATRYSPCRNNHFYNPNVDSDVESDVMNGSIEIVKRISDDAFYGVLFVPLSELRFDRVYMEKESHSLIMRFCASELNSYSFSLKYVATFLTNNSIFMTYNEFIGNHRIISKLYCPFICNRW